MSDDSDRRLPDSAPAQSISANSSQRQSAPLPEPGDAPIAESVKKPFVTLGGVLSTGAVLGVGGFVASTVFLPACQGATRSAKLQWETRQAEVAEQIARIEAELAESASVENSTVEPRQNMTKND